MPLHDRIQLLPEGGGWTLAVSKKYRRYFHFSPDELAWLQVLVNRAVPPVTVTRVEDRGAES